MSDATEGGTPAERLLSPQQPTNPPHQSIPIESPNDGPCCSCMAERLNASRQLYSQQQQQHQQCGEDDPPPYASLMDPSSSNWSYVFPVPPYEDSGGTSGAGNENQAIARPLVTIPLTNYRIYKIEPPRYASVVNPLERHPRLIPENAVAPVKTSGGTARKYGAILIAATVIIFLMALSLMVRFVTEKSLWRG